MGREGERKGGGSEEREAGSEGGSDDMKEGGNDGRRMERAKSRGGREIWRQ